MEKPPIVQNFEQFMRSQTYVCNCPSLVASGNDHISKVNEVSFHKYHITKQLQDRQISPIQCTLAEQTPFSLCNVQYWRGDVLNEKFILQSWNVY